MGRGIAKQLTPVVVLGDDGSVAVEEDGADGHISVLEGCACLVDRHAHRCCTVHYSDSYFYNGQPTEGSHSLA